jgi:hypothetical protein
LIRQPADVLRPPLDQYLVEYISVDNIRAVVRGQGCKIS